MDTNSLEKLKTLKITSLDDDDEEEEEYPANNNINGTTYEEDDEEDDDEDGEPVTLGFVEKPTNQWSLLPHFFPSKAGGFPAWLDTINLPLGKSCVCGICGEPLQFLLQVYAPLFENESTFHRTLFVFMCVSMKCLLQDQHEQWKHHPEMASRSLKVFRCQLPRFNPFYSGEPPRRDGTDKPSDITASLCCWCGTWKGDKVCSSCKRARYCSEKHQVIHWRSGHKIECPQMSIASLASETISNKSSAETKKGKVANKSLWPQFEIVNDDEPEVNTEMSDNNGYTSTLVSGSQVDEGVKSLIENFEGDGDEKSWATFQERVSRAPEQVLRYCRNVRARPLWPMSSGQPSKIDIPKCSYCGGPRGFELQILPQLLYYFGVNNDVDSLDWATIVVYTCEASCDGSIGYQEEFAWVQIASQSTNALR